MGKSKEKTRPEKVDFNTILKKKYEEIMKEHGDFKSIIWDGKNKEFIVIL